MTAMISESVAPARTSWPALKVSNGTLEALKWLGLLLMTGDHVNKYLFNETLPYLFEAGRLTMPIFGFVLGVNLARPGARERGIYRRTLLRMAIAGAIASVPFIALGGVFNHWWPLNIIFALFGVVLVVDLGERGSALAIAGAVVAFVVVGSSVEFWWPAMLFCIAVYWYAKHPGWAPAAIALWALACLAIVNGNFWAMATLPVIYLMTCIDWRLPRARWAFYIYYPLHLAVLWLIRIPMGHAGYLFFT